MKELTITKIYRSTKDKNGKPLKSKDGRPYERVAIKTIQTGDRWVTGFGDETNKKWEEGMTVKVKLKKRGEYLNFKMPSKIDILFEIVNDLKKRVEKLEKNGEEEPAKKDIEDVLFPDEETSGEENPF